MSAKSEIIFDLEDVNISDILDQIHANMKTRGYDVEELKKLGRGIEIKSAFSSGMFNEFLNGSAAAAAASSHVEYWWVIPPQGGVKGKLRVLLNKVMRKLTFFYMKHVMDQQNIFNMHASGALHQLTGTCNHLTQENNDLLMRLTSLTNENASLTSSMQKLSAGIDTTMDKYVRQIAAIEELYAGRQNRLDAVNTAMAARMRALEQTIGELQSKTSAALPEVSAPAPLQYEMSVTVTEKNAAEARTHSPAEDFDYFLFESKFRGSSEEIRRRQEVYLPYFAGKQNVLDIGCGRGEFLKLLQENGISARGADLLPENVRCCQELGVNALLGNGLDLLKSCEDNSLGGIFCAQVIEHLTTAQLTELLRMGRQKLQEGACIILETLNPQCLAIYSESFYMDPSHTHPVHPLTVQFMAECAGFTDNRLLHLSPTAASGLKASPDSPQDEESIRILNNMIFGCREYALVSVK